MAIAVETLSAPRAAPSQARTRIVLALITGALFAPILTLPLIGDDFNVLYWARASVFEPGLLLAPWYGGFLGRLLPKLVLALGMSVVGPRHEVYELLNLLLHVANVLLLERLARVWTGSRRAAFLAALLYGATFGFYGWGVMKISNLSMTLALALTLWAFLEWEKRRRVRALLLWLVALNAHEIILFAPLVAWFAPRGEASLSPRRDRQAAGIVVAALAGVAALAMFPGRIGAVAVRVLQFPAFTLLPIYLGPLLHVRLLGMAVPVGLARFLVQHRLATGLVLLVPLAWAAARQRGLRFAAVWMYAFWLPTAALMAQWPSSALQVRYLQVSAVGVCLFAAVLIDRLPTRGARGLALAGLLAWSLLLVGFTWLGARQIVDKSPRWKQENREFWQELRDLERTRVPMPLSVGPRAAGPGWYFAAARDSAAAPTAPPDPP